jgi:peptidoglycan/xylan/chitin deacetylase (PgdA/CDA1 family)
LIHAGCAAISGSTRRSELRAINELTVLMYHRVLPDKLASAYSLPSLVMPLSAFRSQVSWVASRFEVRTVRDALLHLQERGARRKPLLSISFDDGYVDNYEHAAPALEAAGLRGTFFVTTGPVGTDARLWFDEAAEFWRNVPQRQLTDLTRATLGPMVPSAWSDISGWMAFLKRISPAQRSSMLERLRAAHSQPLDARHRLMTPREIASLQQRGHEIGCHTRWHPLLTQLTDSDLIGEVADPRRDIETWTTSSCAGFCYPNGDVDDRVEQAVRSGGYAYACTTARGRHRPSDGPFRIRRIDMNPRRLLTIRGEHDDAMLRFELSSGLSS